jgi:hypothetical protein
MIDFIAFVNLKFHSTTRSCRFIGSWIYFDDKIWQICFNPFVCRVNVSNNSIPQFCFLTHLSFLKLIITPFRLNGLGKQIAFFPFRVSDLNLFLETISVDNTITVSLFDCHPMNSDPSAIYHLLFRQLLFPLLELEIFSVQIPAQWLS